MLISYYKWYMKEIPIHYAAWMVTLGAIVILIWNVVLPMLIPNNSRLLIDLLWSVEKEWSIPIMLISFGLFEIFRRMVFYSRIVNIIAASSFGVYLITEQPFIREQLWSKWVVLSGFYDSKYAVVQTISCVIIICAVAGVLDLLRDSLFRVTIDRHRGVWFDKIWNLVFFKNRRKIQHPITSVNP